MAPSLTEGAKSKQMWQRRNGDPRDPKELRKMDPCAANKQKQMNASSIVLATMVSKGVLGWPLEAFKNSMAKKHILKTIVGAP